MVGGVCAALAIHLDIPVDRVRLLAVVLAAAGGGGLLLYLWLWALTPHGPLGADDEPGVRHRVPIAALLAGVASVAVVFALSTIDRTPETLTSIALLVGAGASGATVAWSLTFDRRDPGRTVAYGAAVRVIAVALLLLGGSAALVSRPNALNAVIGVTMVVLGVAVAAAPRIVSLWTGLMAERASRVREEQRAEIAAHLHDSVLQTLALIQNRAGASSEVARIARAQERELRDWLFARDSPVTADLATELRDFAASIELDYAARIDVVAVGEFASPSSAPLIAAAREAILNAARHAGGDVSVYLEGSLVAIDVFVRDRGSGVDLATIPDDRLGIRESIVKRMSRAGGTATVGPGAGGTGTEVHLHLEVVNA